MYFIGKDVMINSIYGKKIVEGNLVAKHMVYIWNISKNRSYLNEILQKKFLHWDMVNLNSDFLPLSYKSWNI